MAILERENVPFTQVANEVLTNKTLSLRAKGVYAYMFSKPQNWDFSAERMAEENKDSAYAIRESIVELMKHGFLKRKRQSSGRITYRLTFSTSESNYTIQKPHDEIAKVGKSQSGKSARLSNKEIYIPEWMNKTAWEEWKQHRREKKQTLTPLSTKKQIALLEKNKIDHVAIINRSIEKGWSGLFELPKDVPQGEKPMQGSRVSDQARAFAKQQEEKRQKQEYDENARNNDQLRKLDEMRKNLLKPIPI